MTNADQAAFPFVVGCMRSGTTLVRAMLDSHPEMAVPDESFFVPSLLDQRSALERGGRVDLARFEERLWAWQRFRRWGLDRPAVRAALDAGRPATVPDALRAVYAQYAAVNGKTRYGDKTPLYVKHMPEIAAAFPEARFVHVIRDGRDVALSIVDAHFGPSRIGPAADLWRRRVEAGRAAGRALGDRYTEIRYEQLVADPERVIRAVADFIALDFDPAMLRYFERADALVGPMVKQAHHQHLYQPPTAGLRDWRSALAPGDAALFDLIAGPLLDDLGYGRSGRRPRLTTRARAAAVRAGRAGARGTAAVRRVFRRAP